MDYDFLTTAAAWASIGQLIIAIIALVVEVQRGPNTPRITTRHALTIIVGGFTLAVPGFVIYWLSILIATSSPGTPTSLVVRSASWAALLGITWGIIWARLLLTILVRWIKAEKEIKRGSNDESK
jgi:hypothetical protein